MGQTESSQRMNDMKSKNLVKVHSSAYGDGELCEEEQTFIKCLNFQDKPDLQSQSHLIQTAKRTIHPNLVKALNIEIIEEKSFCSNIFKIYYEMEFFPNDLELERERILCKLEDLE